MRDAEQFLCKKYSPNTDETSINDRRSDPFFKEGWANKHAIYKGPSLCIMVVFIMFQTEIREGEAVSTLGINKLTKFKG